jgi:hypothetical protein
MQSRFKRQSSLLLKNLSMLSGHKTQNFFLLLPFFISLSRSLVSAPACENWQTLSLACSQVSRIESNFKMLSFHAPAC